MGFKIISDKDKNGNFIASSDAWTRDKIEELMDKFYPNRVKKREKKEKRVEKMEEGI
ncbi:hypothetical protein SAMN02745116_02572 [Pilibacter termitis]|uniref:UDP-N-acetylglucosamine 1-carboxyvinyltransferase n=1 Tax=Pilibacter termitis TaxID=263852 RepID=A0A1T4RES2_9ENTE|nr:hypothetical protein [Pilibacter termitis]SKA14504.1 hypothetical protein SAMN02745116_02572 [Pilibacter termitis]